MCLCVSGGGAAPSSTHCDPDSEKTRQLHCPLCINPSLLLLVVWPCGTHVWHAGIYNLLLTGGVYIRICCCVQVDSAYTIGNVAAAQTASRSAKTWNIVGITVGCVSVGVAIVATLIPITVVMLVSVTKY